MGGNSNPFVALTDLRGVDGFVPFERDAVEAEAPGVGLYVTVREDDEAVGDWVNDRYDIVGELTRYKMDDEWLLEMINWLQAQTSRHGQQTRLSCFLSLDCLDAMQYA